MKIYSGHPKLRTPEVARAFIEADANLDTSAEASAEAAEEPEAALVIEADGVENAVAAETDEAGVATAANVSETTWRLLRQVTAHSVRRLDEALRHANRPGVPQAWLEEEDRMMLQQQVEKDVAWLQSAGKAS